MPETANESGKRTTLLFALFAGLCVLAAVGYVVWRARSARRTIDGPAPSAIAASAPEIVAMRAAPHLYFRSAVAGPTFGTVAVASLGQDTARLTTPLKCDRVHFAHGHGICLVDQRAKIHPPAIGILFDAEFHTLHTLDLAGVPSRARISPDGRYAVTTVFTTGDSYTSGASTRTTIFDAESGATVEELERFAITREGKPFREVDFNFWGVTFAKDSNRFYATVASGERTYLLEGDVAARTAKVLRDNAECPSLSPDGAHIAFKKRMPNGAWRLHALDLATMKEWPLPETRNVDDQVEWLDDAHVLYQVIGERGLPEVALNVWVSDATEGASAEPTLYVHSASSPAVVR